MEHQFIISFQIGGFCPLSTDMVCIPSIIIKLALFKQSFSLWLTFYKLYYEKKLALKNWTAFFHN